MNEYDQNCAPYKASDKYYTVCQHYESLNDDDLSAIGLQPKMDPGGIWTSGWGHSIVVNGQFLKGIENKALAYTYTLKDEAEAITLLKKDTSVREMQLNDLKLRINQDMFDGLLDFIFNEGVSNFKSSTLLKMIKANPHDPLIGAQFARWNKGQDKNGNTVVLPGLTLRRKTDAQLYFTGQVVFS